MARTITTGKRFGVVTLAVLGALALPAAASASVSRPTAVDCAALQAAYEGVLVRIDVWQERLATAPPAQKPAIIDQILKYNAQATALEHQLAQGNCP